MWSLGCILGEMLLGKLISAVSSKIHVVFNVLSIFTSAILLVIFMRLAYHHFMSSFQESHFSLAHQL